MKKISDAVREIVSTKPFIESGLDVGIINYSALSNYIKADVEELVYKKVNTGAIQMSLRRMQLISDKINSNKLKTILKDIGDVTIRTDLTDFTYKNSNTLVDCQQKLVELEKKNKDFFFTFAQGVSESTMIVNYSTESKILELFAKEKVIARNLGLASITIKLPPENTKISGLYFHFFKLLAWDNVNICQVISTANEFTIVVENKDAKKAISVLMSLKTNNLF
tara:strand:+ start:2146 stop:2814 length:669 start_codon:yes stop_codon:yes gene_type:complete